MRGGGFGKADDHTWTKEKGSSCKEGERRNHGSDHFALNFWTAIVLREILAVSPNELHENGDRPAFYTLPSAQTERFLKGNRFRL